MKTFIEDSMRTESSEFNMLVDKDTNMYKRERLVHAAIAMDELDTDFETEMQRVINKLKIRYPEKFTREAAEDRDLDAERQELEK